MADARRDNDLELLVKSRDIIGNSPQVPQCWAWPLDAHLCLC